MSRMGEWLLEQDEEHANDLMMCALAHEEELNRQEFEQAARRYPVVITPEAFIHDSTTHSAKDFSGENHGLQRSSDSSS